VEFSTQAFKSCVWRALSKSEFTEPVLKAWERCEMLATLGQWWWTTMDDGAVGKIGVRVPAVGGKWLQRTIAPSGPPETSLRCTQVSYQGCLRVRCQGVDDASGLGDERVRQDAQQTSLVSTGDDGLALLHIANIEYSRHLVPRCTC
jgi:hypothetical protein